MNFYFQMFKKEKIYLKIVLLLHNCFYLNKLETEFLMEVKLENKQKLHSFQSIFFQPKNERISIIFDITKRTFGTFSPDLICHCLLIYQ